jgi:hypothetical protein
LSQAHDCYGYLAVKSLDKYQHDKDRPLTWIKLYHSLLDDYAFCLLRDQDKWLFIGLCLLGTRMNNRIPADPAWLANRLSLTSSVEISGLLKAGLVLKLRSNRSRALPRQSVLRVEESREEESREEQTAPTEDGGARVVIDRRSGLPDRRADYFARFYDKWYPRKIAREDARKAFYKLNPDKATMLAIAADLDRRIKSGEWTPADKERLKFIPYPASYINAKRWTDTP